MKSIVISLIVCFIFNCSLGEKSAGKGVITETTNIGLARGILYSVDSTPLANAWITVYRAHDIPAAWEGVAFARDTTNRSGEWGVSHLFEAEYQAIALSPDSLWMGQLYFTITGLRDTISGLEIQMAPADTLIGFFDEYQNIMDTLPASKSLRANLRGMGHVVSLNNDGSYQFIGVPKGMHYVRIQLVDGIPTHEQTLWEDWISVE